MTREEYLKLVETEFANILKMVKAKNQDYCGNNPDPFANFKMVEQFGVCSTETGILTRLCDKYSRVVSLIDKEAQVKDESIEDTLRDIIGYSVLLMGFLKSKNKDKYDHSNMDIFNADIITNVCKEFEKEKK